MPQYSTRATRGPCRAEFYFILFYIQSSTHTSTATATAIKIKCVGVEKWGLLGLETVTKVSRRDLSIFPKAVVWTLLAPWHPLSKIRCAETRALNVVPGLCDTALRSTNHRNQQSTDAGMRPMQRTPPTFPPPPSSSSASPPPPQMCAAQMESEARAASERDFLEMSTAGKTRVLYLEQWKAGASARLLRLQQRLDVSVPEQVGRRFQWCGRGQGRVHGCTTAASCDSWSTATKRNLCTK